MPCIKVYEHMTDRGVYEGYFQVLKKKSPLQRPDDVKFNIREKCFVLNENYYSRIESECLKNY